jgi:sporulation protein YlmC with PRC-barrel domain
MKTGVILLSSLMLAGTGAVMAQQPGQPGQQPPGQQQPGQPGQQPGQPSQQPGQQPGQPSQQPGQAAQPRPDVGDRQAADERRRDGAALTQRREGQIRSDELVGSDVLDSAGEKIASVDELLIDNDGQITALLVSVGGVVGIGSRTVAISWDDANVERTREDGVFTDRYEVRTMMTQQQLENAPEFQDETD